LPLILQQHLRVNILHVQNILLFGDDCIADYGRVCILFLCKEQPAVTKRKGSTAAAERFTAYTADRNEKRTYGSKKIFGQHAFKEIKIFFKIIHFMITVIIPALNEQDTIAKVIEHCAAEQHVTEIIVIDDQSTDATRLVAEGAGAKVIVSAMRGKGISMKEGITFATNQVLVFLDADIHPYPAETVKKLTAPILNNECDFVKGAFARNAGRVTELVAKPLLKIFYPELSDFQQPLSGMIAGKKSFFSRIDFFQDYGVDIGILIDMFLMQARVKEVNIGYIENKSKPWQMLGKMSGEVSRAIIRRATLRNGNSVGLDELGTVNIITSEMENVVKEEIGILNKMVVFDMDNTLLRGRFIDTCAEKFNFADRLAALRKTEKDPAVLTKRIAMLLRGLSHSDLLETAASIPIVTDAASVIEVLQNDGVKVGIISNSYQIVVDYVKNQVGADFAFANRLEFFEGKATGEVIIPAMFYNNLESKCGHTICKTNVLQQAARKYHVATGNCIAIGDSENDLCMIEQAGLGIAFCTGNEELRKYADKVIDKPSFAGLLSMVHMNTPSQRKSIESVTH
jgi:glucosyl-3-phosphoglycerate synthase